MSSKRVLIIEDSDDAALALSLLLQAAGHVVEVAHTGPEGLRKSRDFRPQVVLCDVRLPGLDGYSVARSLRADPAARGVTLVALSGFTEAEDRALALDAGFDHHVGKPVTPEALLRLIAGARGSD